MKVTPGNSTPWRMIFKEFIFFISSFLSLMYLFISSEFCSYFYYFDNKFTLRSLIPSSKLALNWPSHFGIYLNDCDRRAIRCFRSAFQSQKTHLNYKYFLKVNIHICDQFCTRKEREKFKKFQLLLQLFSSHKTHRFHVTTLDFVRSVKSSLCFVEVADKVARVRRRG